MSRRRRILLAAGAVVCLGLAAGLFLLAVDMRRWQRDLSADDARYLAAPGDRLWQPATILPGDPAARLLGISDDVTFRNALRTLRLGRLEQGFTSNPALALPRAEAQARLVTVAKDDPYAQRRSRALGLLGVVAFQVSETGVQDRERQLGEAVGAYQAAIDADPDNDEAKLNLELALQQQAALQALPSSGLANPSRGGAGLTL